MKWEYQDLMCGRHEMGRVMEEFGNERWECFQVIWKPSRGEFSSSVDHHLFFKRNNTTKSKDGARK